MSTRGWVDDSNAALLTDLYQLTMLEAYFDEGLCERATFDLFVRRLPSTRNFLVACGLDDVLHYLEHLAFGSDAIAALERLRRFSSRFLDRLAALRFTGDVDAVPEGSVVFADEPLLEVTAPLPEAQLVESFLLNQIHVATLAASKAARVVRAARGRPVVEFGLRRMQGSDAAMKVARAAFVAGFAATSNVLAGVDYGIPLSGTMAHSYVEAHADERAALRSFATRVHGAVLLVDTYDVRRAVERVIELARELDRDFRPRAIRLDSGDLGALAHEARAMLDAAGLGDIEVLASSNLDEYEIEALLENGAPIDGFGVGTRLAVSSDAPSLDMAYKLVEYAGQGRMKLATAKATLPGRKQVFRRLRAGSAIGDVVASADERLDDLRSADGDATRPLLVPVMRGGRRLDAGCASLAAARAHAAKEIATLPDALRALSRADPPYPVEVSGALRAEAEKLRRTFD